MRDRDEAKKEAVENVCVCLFSYTGVSSMVFSLFLYNKEGRSLL